MAKRLRIPYKRQLIATAVVIGAVATFGLFFRDNKAPMPVNIPENPVGLRGSSNKAPRNRRDSKIRDSGSSLNKTQQEQDRELLQDLEQEYTSESIGCSKTTPELGFDPIEYINYFSGSGQVFNPPSSYKVPIQYFHRLEQASTNTLFRALEHFDSIGVVERTENGTYQAKIVGYAIKANINAPRANTCDTNSGQAYDNMRRAITILIGRAFDEEEDLSIRQVAEQIPETGKQEFYLQLSRAIFREDSEFAYGILSELNREQRQGLFREIVPFVFINQSYRNMIDDLIRMSEANMNTEIQQGLQGVLATVRERESLLNNQ